MRRVNDRKRITFGAGLRAPIRSLILLTLLATACKQTDFSGNSPSAGTPKPAANSSGTAGGGGAAPASGPVPGATDAGGNGTTPAVPSLGSGPVSALPSAPPPSPAVSSGNTNLFQSIVGALGTAGSVAGSAIQAATPKPPANMNPCSQVYFVPGTASPYMAGEPSGTSVTYDLSQGGGPNPTDTVDGDAPILVQTTSNCLVPGNSIFFFVYGDITYDKSVAPVNANGKLSQVLSHQKGAMFGKSNIVAPLCALLGVFLGDGDPTNSAAPTGLDFSTQAARDYTTLSPQLGQIFFIGTGQTSSGASHEIVVPAGATRLFLSAMDTYQWNNNIGGVSAQLLVRKTTN